MRRWAAFAALLLLLGAVTTVLVAWVMAATESIWWRDEPLASASEMQSVRSMTTTGWERRVYGVGMATTVVDLEPIDAWVDLGDLRVAPTAPFELPSWDASRERCVNDRRVTHELQGWPFHCMVVTRIDGYYTSLKVPIQPESKSISLDEGLPIVSIGLGLFVDDLPLRRDDRIASMGPFDITAESASRRIPFRPIVAGFAMNAMVFAAAWGGLVLSPPAVRALRRHRRRRQRRCPWCGQQRVPGAVAPCTECGRLSDEQVRTPGRAVFIIAITATLLTASCAAAVAIGLHSLHRSCDDPIEIAVWREDLDAVVALIDAWESSPEAASRAFGMPAPCRSLQYSALYGRTELVQALLDRGGDPVCAWDTLEDWDAYWRSPLAQAVLVGCPETIELLIDRVESTAHDNPTEQQRLRNGAILSRMLVQAASRGDAATVRSILMRAPSWRYGLIAYGRSFATRLVQSAAMGGSPDAVRQILDSLRGDGELATILHDQEWWRNDPWTPEFMSDWAQFEEANRALAGAARWRRHEMVELLFSEGANIRVPTHTGRASADAQLGDDPPSEDDADAGTESDVTTLPDRILEAAILSGDATMVRRILDAGAPADSELHPSLSIAMAFRYHDIARLLVERGADPNRRHWLLGTPLHAVKAMGLPASSLRLLREFGAVDEAPGDPLDGESSP